MPIPAVPEYSEVWRRRRGRLVSLPPPTAEFTRQLTNGRLSFPVALDRHTLIYLATDADGAGPWMYAVDVDRKVSHRISSGLESYSSLAASGDGRRLVATIARRRHSVWRIPLDANAPTDVAAAGSPTLLLDNGSNPRLAAESLLYVSSRGERQGIWSQSQLSKAEAAAHEIWSSAHSHIAGSPVFSPDQHRIAFAVEETGKTILYVMNADGSNPRVVSEALALRGSPSWDLELIERPPPPDAP